jgi:DNA-binding LytR/AlgR family response regulator
MIRLALVEDDDKAISILEGYLKQIIENRVHDIEWDVYSGGEAFLWSFKPGKYDILLLDIQLPGIDGIELARQIRAQDNSVLIMFITNLAQYAVQGYSVRAFDFMVKPIECALFTQKLRAAIEHLHRTGQDTISFKVAEGIVNLEPAQILFFGIESRRLLIHTKERVYRCNDSLQNIERRLDDKRFFRCHSGYLVNMAYVRSIYKSHAMVREARVPISRNRRKDFLYAMGNYLGREVQ